MACGEKKPDLVFEMHWLQRHHEIWHQPLGLFMKNPSREQLEGLSLLHLIKKSLSYINKSKVFKCQDFNRNKYAQAFKTFLVRQQKINNTTILKPLKQLSSSSFYICLWFCCNIFIKTSIYSKLHGQLCT